MNKTILISVLVVMIIILAVITDLKTIPQSKPVMNVPLPNITSNNSTTTNIISTQEKQNAQSNTKTSNNMITSNQATNIALNYAKNFFPTAQWSVLHVDFVNASNYKNNPNYMIELNNNAPDALSTTGTSMDVRINAHTGIIKD
jgi:hypothetical protein